MNLPTFLSLIRACVAFLFLSSNPLMRLAAIIIAAVTDYLDGFLARRLGQITPLGTIVDPLADKLFVGMALGILSYEGTLCLWQVAIFLLREISLLLFCFWLLCKGQYKQWKIRSFISGKWMTTFQFIALGYLALGFQVPALLWLALGIAGISSLFELVFLSQKKPVCQ